MPVGDPTRRDAAPDCVLDLVLSDTAIAAYDGDRKGADAQRGMEVSFGTVTLGVSNLGIFERRPPEEPLSEIHPMRDDLCV